jgi:chemotaxis protein methyltransferase CheR
MHHQQPHRPASANRPEHVACERVRQWLYDRCGIYFTDNKREMLAHRLGKVIDHFHLSGLPELAEQVEREEHHDLLQAVVHAASINHTYFFREPQTLNFFRDTILRPLSARESVRVWSAAVASGDEAYTIGIIAAELWGPRAAQNRLAILGTDISKPIIQRAETGVYSHAHIENVPPNLLTRYFAPLTEDHYSISDSIRHMCTFRRLNLKAYPYPFKRYFDVIFCRNILYYFDRPHQQQVLSAMYDVCTPGGWLITSVTETLRDLDTPWTCAEAGIYRKLS